MTCSGTSDCMCGCCAGTSVQTPQPEANPPGLPAIARRVGTWAQFKESMLARLSSSDYPALNPLTTRSDDDFTVAVLDATSVVLDILTFYQERLSNEAYLRTAQQPRSLTELSRLIGYAPTPGVSAAAYVAFTLTQPVGQPADPNAPAITIPQGTQVQSVPPQGQTAQTFETSAPILAKADWTALPVQTGLPWVPNRVDTFVYLEGTATQIQPGDLFLIVGNERIGNPSDMNWDVRMVATVEADGANDRTLVTWAEPLGSGSVGPSAESPGFFVFRQRASLFGYNAIQPQMLNTNSSPQPSNITSLLEPPGYTEWANFYPTTTVDLDSSYPKVTNGGWVALVGKSSDTSRIPAGYISLYHVSSVANVSRTDFGISGKITSVIPDTTAGLSGYNPRTTTAFAQSEQQGVAEQPLTVPLYGTLVSLEVLRNDMAGVQVIALSGKRQKIAYGGAASTITFTPDDFSATRYLVPGEILALTSAANLPTNTDGTIADWSAAAAPLTLFVADSSGRTGTILAPLSLFALSPSVAADPLVSECALVSQVSNDFSVGGSVDYYHTWFSLSSALTYCYERASTSVNANVGLATAGQSVTEILGSGSAATQDQEFTLKQMPLTFVQAPTPTGFASTLEVQANGMDWTEVPSLYLAAPSVQVYATLNQSDGSTDVLFGDGQEGATLPTGTNNIVADYRIGSGSAGNVAAGTITTLMDRPLGVSGVTNPAGATGGQDPQSPAAIRQNAPQTVLTLGRAVSITDYQNFASTFAGVSKAYAIWIPSGPARGVFLTIAGVAGAEVAATSPTFGYLVAALQSYGNPLIPLTVQSYVETLFSLYGTVLYDASYDQPTVQAQVLQTLASAFSFAARTFGQGVSADEVSTVIQGVPGVVAVNITGLAWGVSSQGGDLGQTGAPTVTQWNNWNAGAITLPVTRPPSSVNTLTQLCPYLPVPGPNAQPAPAEIIVLDPRPSGVNLGPMP